MYLSVAWESSDGATAADGAVWADPLVRLLQAEVRLRGERIAELESDNQQLRARVAELEGKVETERRAGKRQAAPFSRGERKTDPGRGGRKPGQAYGTKARRLPPPPEQVDEVVEVGLPVCCPDCGGQVTLDEVVAQLQEELVPAHSRMRRYDVALGHCEGCKRRVRSRHPEQTSDALGAAGVMLGPRAHALAAWLHVGLGVPMAKTSKILAGLGGLAVTPGGLHSALHKTAGDAETTYAALLEALRSSTAVAADETGWRIDAERNWLWTYVGDTVTVYDIAPGRGYDHAKQVLGEDFAGVIERDGWAAYRKFTEATHQTCLAHYAERAVMRRRPVTASVAPAQAGGRHYASPHNRDAHALIETPSSRNPTEKASDRKAIECPGCSAVGIVCADRHRPSDALLAVLECLRLCGLEQRSQPLDQQQHAPIRSRSA